MLGRALDKIVWESPSGEPGARCRETCGLQHPAAGNPSQAFLFHLVRSWRLGTRSSDFLDLERQQN